MKSLKNKKGNEILQVLVIVAIIGALAITVAMAISGKLRNTTNEGLKNVGNGIAVGVSQAATPINIAN